MRVTFPYPHFPDLEVPDANLLGVFSPAQSESPQPEERIIRRGLENPIGSPRLGDLARADSRLLLLPDDHTRVTPIAKILPSVLEELLEAGVQEKNLRFLISLGSHRPMTGPEIAAKLGPSISQRFQVQSHDWSKEAELIALGTTDSGVEIQVNRAIQEADLIVGFGNIAPHRVAGFSGGGKIIQPGICGSRTTDQIHWASALYPGAQIFGQAENPVRQEIEAVALRAGLTFIINTVLDSKGRIAHLVAGDPIKAHRQGAQRSMELHGVRLPQPATIVITDSHPTDADLWVAAKGFYASELAVRQGGVVILVTPCPDGICYGHPEVLKYGYRPVEEVKEIVERGDFKDLTAAAHVAHMGRIVRDLARGILVSPGISPLEAQRLHLAHAPTPQAALNLALSWTGEDASIAVFSRGAEVLPLVGEAS